MISEIVAKQKFELENVLHYHGWVTQPQLNDVFVKAEELMNNYNAKKNGDIVTATNAIEVREGQQMMEINIFIPIDKEIDLSANFDFIKIFKIENALKIRIEGNPQQSQAAMQKLNEHIQSNSLVPSTPVCMVTVKGATTPLEINDMIIDMYVGIVNK